MLKSIEEQGRSFQFVRRSGSKAEVVHFATGMVVGYPPCPYIDQLRDFVKQKYDVDVVIGTHPIPQKYYLTHEALGTWKSPEWKERIKHVLTDEQTRSKYN